MARPNLEITVEEITPRIAKEWLEFNTHNRRVSERLVSIYAEAMRNREWRLNGETLIFDKTGRLQSGQHRLLACIESGVSFWSIIVRGTEPASLFTLDTGRKRSLTDALVLRGETNASALATCITYRWRYEHGLMAGAPTPPTVPTLLSYLEANPSLRDALKAGYKLVSALGVSAGMYSAMYDVFCSLDAENADQFTDLLKTGEGLDSSSPIFILRRWIVRAAVKAERPSVPMYAAVIVKSWNAWRTHSVVRQLFWRAEEDFPEAI